MPRAMESFRHRAIGAVSNSSLWAQCLVLKVIWGNVVFPELEVRKHGKEPPCAAFRPLSSFLLENGISKLKRQFKAPNVSKHCGQEQSTPNSEIPLLLPTNTSVKPP